MNVLTKPTIENMVSEEIQQQLESLPIQVSNSINKAEAIAHALNFLHPIYFSAEPERYWQNEPTKNMLLEIISDLASLSLIRLVGSLSRSQPAIAQYGSFKSDSISLS